MFLAVTNNGTIQTFAISIVDDDLVEGTESFVISGSVTSPASFLPRRNMATITIMDNERKLYVKLTVKVASSLIYTFCLKKKFHHRLVHFRMCPM